MAFFKDDAEIYHYIGGIFRSINDDTRLKAVASKATFSLKARYLDPEACLTVQFTPDGVVVTEGDHPDVKPDIETQMKADYADKFWRGEFNFLANLAIGRVKMRGAPTTLMKLAPLQPSLFKAYKERIAEKDAA